MQDLIYFFLLKIRNDDSMSKIKENEWLAVEPFLEGNYKKFISNTNETSTFGDALPTFMHWNWVYSRGEKVVSDIQGVIKNGYYHLTDPAVQSVNQEYGLTDLGPYGILVFLAKHRHTQFCQNLPWPNYETIKLIRSFHIAGNRRTTFSFEFHHDPKIRPFYMNIKKSVFK